MVTGDDLRRALLDHGPEVVHFCGHGLDSAGIEFEDDAGQVREIDGESLARLFGLVADTVKCVLLNACYTESQADPLSRYIDYVAGTKGAIRGPAASKFAAAFYGALGGRRRLRGRS